MKERILNIISIVFDISISIINENSSPENIENWDSIGNLNLIVSLEDEFDIKFTDEEISEMLNFKLIEEILVQKLNKII